MQRVYFNDNEMYIDYEVDGEEASIGYDKEKIMQTLRDLKYEWPIYFSNHRGEEELVEARKDKGMDSL